MSHQVDIRDLIGQVVTSSICGNFSSSVHKELKIHVKLNSLQPIVRYEVWLNNELAYLSDSLSDALITYNAV